MSKRRYGCCNGIDLGQIGDEFRIADFGPAQGENSLLPTNDWTTLFQTVLSLPIIEKLRMLDVLREPAPF